jgi:hypothetical protein
MKILGKLQTTDTTTVTNLNADTLDGYSSEYFAPKASPTFTGTVSAQTATLSDVLTLTGGGYNTTLDSKGYAGLLVNITGTGSSSAVEAFKLNPAAGKGFLFGSELLTKANIPTFNQDTTGSSASCTGNAATVTTNANLTGHITSTGNATVLGSFSSAQLFTALTDKTGSGANVFATSPSLVTPILGTPQSGNLINCTFPTFNQDTTGSSASCTGNAATATNLLGGGVTTTTAGVMTAKSLELKAEIPKITLWDITNSTNTDKYFLQANKNAFSISAILGDVTYQGKSNAPLFIEYKDDADAVSKSMWLFGTKIISLGELTTAITTFKTDTIDSDDDAKGYSKRNHHHTALRFNSVLYAPSLSAEANTLVARDVNGAIAASLPYSSITGTPTKATTKPSYAYSEITGTPTIPTTLPASDVYAWAKATAKPSYAYSEITGTPTTLPASDVYAWAKATAKPSYAYSEITGTPTIPTTLPASDVYAWAKATAKPSYNYSEITGNVTGTLTIAGGAQIQGGAQASISIGTITTSRTLDVGGALTVGGSTTIVGGTYSTTWAKASDDRLKTRLATLNNVLPALNSLTCFNYTYNQLYQAITGQLDNRRYLGLSAQELNHAFPTVVVNNTLTDTEGNSYLGVSYEALIPVIIQAIKELTTAIEDLKQPTI